MYLKELIVENFQIHGEKRIVKFTKGLNVIIGDTGKGKSSLVRALYLHFMNQPRNAEAIFKNKHTDNPIKIKTIDSNDNTLKRFKRQYFLNDSPKPLKKFGTDIPKPITELYKFKEINWQKQLDPHFLILQTGGTAAKIMNASSGMEDQELLMNEVKSRISNHKSNIKRILENNKDYYKTIRDLKSVTRLLMKAKAIQILKTKSNETQNNIDTLNTLIVNLNECRIDPKKYITINLMLSEINQIELIEEERSKLIHDINKLNSICNQLQEIKYSFR